MHPVAPSTLAVDFAFAVYGTSFRVRLSRAEHLDAIKAVLPYGWDPAQGPTAEFDYTLRDAPPEGGDVTLSVNGEPLACPGSLGAALAVFGHDVLVRAASRARDRVFVHAGAVGWNGQAVLIPGRSMHGKSTLVGELTLAGATYYSDEYAVLDERGRVHPYGRPIAVRARHRSGKAVRIDIAAEALGARAGGEPLPVGLVLVTRYQPGASWRPRPMTPGEGVLALFENTVSAQTAPDLALRALHRAVERATVLGGPRGEASDVVEDVRRRLGEPM